MGYTATTETIDHIAALVEQQRPEWEPALVKIILRSHVSHVDGTDLAVAALRAATNLNLPSPKAIGWRGPHWDGLATKPPEITDLRWCSVCGRREPDCYAVRHAGDDHTFEASARPPRNRR